MAADRLKIPVSSCEATALLRQDDATKWTCPITPRSLMRVERAFCLVLFDSHFHSRDNVTTPITYELQNGITSFRDPGHPFKYYDQLLGSGKVIPRVFLNGGHLDAEPVVWPDQAKRIASDEDAVAAVDSHVNRGASAIKVYFRLPLQHIRAACGAAKRRNVPVTAHLELVDADDAIRAGVIGIEHVTSFGTSWPIRASDAVQRSCSRRFRCTKRVAVSAVGADRLGKQSTYSAAPKVDC